MIRSMQRLTNIVILLAATTLAVPAAIAQGNSANALGMNKNLGHGNASDGVKAMIHSNRDVLYAGDDRLELEVRFPRGAGMLTDGDVDAHLVIFGPEAIWDVLPLSDEASDGSGKLFELAENEIEALPAGVYQLGVVLTVPDGDPFIVEDWYNGLLGLLSVRGVTVADGPIDEDADGDGALDDDADDDGIADDDDEEDDSSNDTDDDSNDDTTDDSTT